MFWPMIAIALGFLGLAVLGVAAIRVFTEVRRLAREVDLATDRIQRAARDLERAAQPLAAQAGQAHQGGQPGSVNGNGTYGVENQT